MNTYFKTITLDDLVEMTPFQRDCTIFLSGILPRKQADKLRKRIRVMARAGDV